MIYLLLAPQAPVREGTIIVVGSPSVLAPPDDAPSPSAATEHSAGAAVSQPPAGQATLARDFAQQLGFSRLDQLNEVGHNLLHIAIEQLRLQNLDPPEVAIAVAESLPDHLIEGSLVLCLLTTTTSTQKQSEIQARTKVRST